MGEPKSEPWFAKYFFQILLLLLGGGGGLFTYCEYYDNNKCPDRKQVSSGVRTESHKPVAGVTVVLNSAPTDPRQITDAEGAFTFNNIPNADSAIFLVELKGTYHRFARKMNFCDEDGAVTPDAIVVPDSLLVMPPAPPPPPSAPTPTPTPTPTPGPAPGVNPPPANKAALPIVMSGSVYDAVSKAPLEKVRVSGEGGTVYTDEDGNFLLKLPQEPDTKDVLIKYRLEGYEPYSYRYYDYPKASISVPLDKKQ